MDRELGYELYLLDPARGVDLWNRVLEAGKRYNIAPTGRPTSAASRPASSTTAST